MAKLIFIHSVICLLLSRNAQVNTKNWLKTLIVSNKYINGCFNIRKQVS